MVSEFYVDKAIISSKGVDYHKGITDYNEREAGIKKRMLSSAATKILAVDGNKFGRVSFTKIMDFSELDVVVTDYEMDEAWLEKLEDCKVQVLAV